MVGRWRAQGQALDLALLPMQGMLLGLGAGDDGGVLLGGEQHHIRESGGRALAGPLTTSSEVYTSFIQQTFSKASRDKGVSHKPFKEKSEANASKSGFPEI